MSQLAHLSTANEIKREVMQPFLRKRRQSVFGKKKKKKKKPKGVTFTVVSSTLILIKCLVI